MSKALNPELVLFRTKAGTLQNVQKLNLCGNDLSDLSLFREMPNLEVVSLSVNQISTLRYFQHCPKLRELYLRSNLIGSLNELAHLQPLQQLSVLWLLENPCADEENYRLKVIAALPSVNKLDNQPVTNEERTKAQAFKGRVAAQPEVPRQEVKREAPRAEVQKQVREEVQVREVREEVKREVREEPRPVRREELKQEPPVVQNLPPRAREQTPERVVKREEVRNHIEEPRREPAINEAKQGEQARERKVNRDNILCAIFALLKEVDEPGLELIHRDIKRKLNNKC